MDSELHWCFGKHERTWLMGLVDIYGVGSGFIVRWRRRWSDKSDNAFSFVRYPCTLDMWMIWALKFSSEILIWVCTIKLRNLKNTGSMFVCMFVKSTNYSGTPGPIYFIASKLFYEASVANFRDKVDITPTGRVLLAQLSHVPYFYVRVKPEI